MPNNNALTRFMIEQKVKLSDIGEYAQQKGFDKVDEFGERFFALFPHRNGRIYESEVLAQKRGEIPDRTIYFERNPGYERQLQEKRRKERVERYKRANGIVHYHQDVNSRRFIP